MLEVDDDVVSELVVEFLEDTHEALLVDPPLALVQGIADAHAAQHRGQARGEVVEERGLDPMTVADRLDLDDVSFDEVEDFEGRNTTTEFLAGAIHARLAARIADGALGDGGRALEHLRRYDVGRLDPDSDYAERYPDQRPSDGARIPTLAQVLDRVKAAEGVELWIELKTEPGAYVKFTTHVGRCLR